MRRWVELYSSGALGLPVRKRDREIVFSSGAAADDVYFMREGSIEILHASPDGKGVLVKILVAPTLFGAIEPLGDVATYLETVRVLDTATVARLSRAQFLEVVSHDAQASYECLLDVGRAFCVTAQLEPARMYSTEAQLAAVLLAYADACSETKDGVATLRVGRTQADLAQAVGGGERSVNRALSAWRAQGLIDKKEARYVLKDQEALREIACGLEAGLVHRCRPLPREASG